MLDENVNVDYIIVGAGLAGIAFAETCLNNGKSIFVFDNKSQNSSIIAGGLYNPVILKRFTGLEYAQAQLDEMQSFYTIIQRKLNCIFDFKIPILRKFFSIEEVNNWFVASDKSSLAPFLSLKIVKRVFSGIEASYGYGQVLQTGFVDTASMLKNYHHFLLQSSSLSNDLFAYDKLVFTKTSVCYKNIRAKNILFAEGFGLNANPYFNYLPLDGTKGELFIIKCVALNLDVIINTSVFIIPLGNDLFKIGATYNWFDKSNDPTVSGKNELLAKIREVLKCDFDIVEHLAGVRPTVRDRKPLLGTHPNYKSAHIMNGLGTRGVMLGPWTAKILFNAIECNTEIERSLNINRFEYLFNNSAITL